MISLKISGKIRKIFPELLVAIPTFCRKDLFEIDRLSTVMFHDTCIPMFSILCLDLY